MKERKCLSCKLTYKGLKERCPFCHKLTKLGIFNRIMSVLGYISLIFWLIVFAHVFIASVIIDMIWFMPAIAVIFVIAIIVGICFFIFK